MFPALIHRTKTIHNVFININPSPLWQLQDLLKDYEKNKCQKHYAEAVLSFNKMKQFVPVKPVITKEIKASALAKIKRLKIKKFIFMVPSANFVLKLEDSFWNGLSEKLRMNGYDIFINSPDLTIAEAFYIASLSKGIIGLRCGFTEVLSILPIPKYIIYTPCKHFDWVDIEEKLTLKKYPCVNVKTIFEYNSLKTDLSEIEYDILGRLK